MQNLQSIKITKSVVSFIERDWYLFFSLKQKTIYKQNFELQIIIQSVYDFTFASFCLYSSYSFNLQPC